MPVALCSNGKWRIGNGPCVYHSKERAERAWAAAKAHGLSEEDFSIAVGLAEECALQLGAAISLSEIQRCVADEEWQRFRVSLKGLSTAEKLRRLRSYKTNHSGRCVAVRVDNYLNALRRGGQLPPKGQK
jgi:hypothetical protein